jgi:glycerate kinase
MPTAFVVGQAFKGSLGASAVADALAAGVAAAGVEADVLVGSDGGDGLLEAVAPPRRTVHRVTGPRGRPVDVPIGWLEDGTAVIESRLACGVALLPHRARDPERTTTRGVGELMMAAVSAGAESLIVGLGGSATMDGGLGAARAWGWKALDAYGQPLADVGGALGDLSTIESGHAFPKPVLALCDVTNRLLGPDGAAVFARQKGAKPAAAARLAAGLARLVDAAAAWDGPALAERPGAGAAGGLGFGLLCFARADVTPGAQWILGRARGASRLAEADLVVVAEAAFDTTSLGGKLTGEVIAAAWDAEVPVVVLTPNARVHPPGVSVVSEPGRWRPGDLVRIAERAVRSTLRLPAS